MSRAMFPSPVFPRSRRGPPARPSSLGDLVAIRKPAGSTAQLDLWDAFIIGWEGVEPAETFVKSSLNPRPSPLRLQLVSHQLRAVRKR